MGKPAPISDDTRSPRRKQSGGSHGPPSVAVVIPCLNEEPTIGSVVRGFKGALPHAAVIVVDNDSTDRSIEEASRAGAQVMIERRRGKGYVVQTALAKVEADAYLIVDGDDTYPPTKAAELVAPILRDEADMVVGSRMSPSSNSQFRLANRIGNEFYRQVINLTFGTHLSDILSGYRCLSRRLVRGLPLFVTGFEVEAELTIKSLERGYRILEIPIDLGDRPSGSRSKIRIVRDGLRILTTILALFRDYKPLTFFGGAGLILLLAGGLLAGVLSFRYGTIGSSLSAPAAILATGLLAAGFTLLAVGLVLHTVNRRFQEMERHMRLLGKE
jgi:glycosyltransferase involved in cell wall biosynthesis